MLKLTDLFSSLLIASIFLSNSASAAAITNGTFDSDLSGWSTVTDNGSVIQDSGAAVLSTGPSAAPFSAVLVQGDAGDFSFLSPILLGAGDDFLRFDAVFSTLGLDVSEVGGSSFTDYLELWMYDASGSGDVLLATIDELTSDTSFSFNLATYITHSVAFSFELNDEDDGFNSKVTIDNVRLEPRVTPPVNVPEPNTLMLMIFGIFGLAGRRLSQK